MALIPSFFLDCVVAIGIDTTPKEFQWISSGFLYGHFLESVGNKNAYLVYLITNRHVFQGKSHLYVRFNPIVQEKARPYKLPLLDKNDKPLWFTSPDTEKDIAVIVINVKKIKDEGLQFSYFQSDQHAANISKLEELGITEGDYAYTLGFPMGLIGGDRNFVIVRSGSIARICDTLMRANKEFLVDTFVFPGNSGGPVVSKPEALAISGTKSQSAAYLIGIVKSYIPYEDVAVSLQTQRPRVTFEENSGLAAVHPIDFIQEVIQEQLKSQKVLKEDLVSEYQKRT